MQPRGVVSGESPRPLSALLSQALVAFTLELDGEFERRMGQAGYPGARLSLVVWANLMRFAGEGGVSVRHLATQALAPVERIKFQLGCLERWGFILLQPAPLSARRPGWGSGRGIRADSLLRLTPKGLAATRIWPPLFAEIEQRWERRFGTEQIACLRAALQHITVQLEVDLPQALPAGWETFDAFPPRSQPAGDRLPLSALLSQLLLAFRIESDRESPAPLALSANTLRVLGGKPIRLAEIPILTGGSPETTGIGWQMKPYVVVAPDPDAARGKVVCLSPRGLAAQQAYHRLVREIEKRWEAKFGAEGIRLLRDSLEQLFERGADGAPLIAQGLAPPPDTARAGSQTPSLGRRIAGAAARQRMRDMVAQTEAFVRDPPGALPHHPLWDMNRGFGP